MEQFGFHWTYFRDIVHMNIFRKPTEKIQVSLKSDKDTGYFTKIHMWLVIISRPVLLRTRNVCDQMYREARHTHFYVQNVFPKIASFMRCCEKIW